MHGNSDQTNSQKIKRKMRRTKLNSKNVVNQHFSSIPCIPSFGNNISDIINKFENSPKSHSTIIPIESKHVTHSNHNNIDSESKFSTEKSKNVINSTINKEKNKFSHEKRYCKQSACKMYESNGSDLNDDYEHEQCNNNGNEALTNNNDTIEIDDAYDIIDTSINLSNYEFEHMNDDNTATTTKFQRLKNINLIKCQLNLFQRIVGIVLSFPFFSSINGAGLTTLSCAFFLPRILCENILYPIFRLTLGTLYPAYASYKAVRNKDVKDYVSDISYSKKNFEKKKNSKLLKAQKK